MSSAYFAALVGQPIVITEAGTYRTRGGETVTVSTVSDRHDFGCLGEYKSGEAERWHMSGRLWAGRENQNDIVAKIN